MDAIIRGHEAQLTKCKEQIGKSHEIISHSMSWLAAYLDSVGGGWHTWGFCVLRTAPLIASENAAESRK